MQRWFSALFTVLVVAALAVPGAQAADKKKKGAKGKKAAAAAPTSAEIEKALVDVKWGMSKDDVEKVFIDKIKAKYRPLVSKTKDAVEEDRLRQRAKQELSQIREGYVEFDGRTTGWDVSFLKGEFTHKNDEAMLVVKDENSQNFYFFIGGRLWKWYKAFDAAVFPSDNFATFAGAVQKKFGPAREAEGELRPGAGKRHWLEWQDKETRLRAVDETDFYGFYSLVFEEKGTLDNLARLRSNDEGPQDKSHSLVESVTADIEEDSDARPNIVDRITGKIREREDAPEPAAASSSGGSSASAGKQKTKPKPADAEMDPSDDPLSGL